MKYGGKAARGTGHVIGVTGKTLGSAALHPQRTLMGAGKAMQTAAVGSAAGYVTWEKLTTDKSVARIVGDAVIGENATEAVAQTFMVFGRFGWMSKIAGALLGAMIIGNNSKVAQTLPNRGGTSSHGQNMKEAETQSRGMKR